MGRPTEGEAMSESPKKFCLTCLSEGSIKVVPGSYHHPQECQASEHRTRFENKQGYDKTLNDLIDQKLNEVESLLGVFLDQMENKDE